MPYLLRQDGSLDFIQDQSEYNLKLQQEWSEKDVSDSNTEELPSDAYNYPLKAPEDNTDKVISEADKVIESNDKFLNQDWAQTYLKGEDFWSQPVPDKWGDVGTQIRQGVAKTIQKVLPTDTRAAAINKREELIEKNKEDDARLDEEYLRFLPRIPQSAINAVISFPEQAIRTGFIDPQYLFHKLGLPPEKYLSEKSAAKSREYFEQYELNSQELQKTGRLYGERLGYKKNWPLGKYISNDSSWVQENITPKSDVVDLSAKVAGAILTIKLGGLFGKGTGATQPYISRGIPKSKIGQVKNIIGGFLLAVAREGKEEALLFPPDPAIIDEDLIQNYREALQGADFETQNNIRRAFLAETDYEYNYYLRQIQQASIGGGIAGGLNLSGRFLAGIIRGARRARIVANNAKKPVSEQIIDVAFEEVKPDLDDTFNKITRQNASTEVSEKIGDVTGKFEDNVSTEIPEIATTARDISEDFLVTSEKSVNKAEELTKDINLTSESVSGTITKLETEIASVKKELNVKTDEDLAKKIALLNKRMEAYSLLLDKDPDWIKKSTGTGKKRTKNRTKFRLLDKAIKRVKRLEELQTELEKIKRIEADNIAKSNEIVNEQTNIVLSANNFQKNLDEMRATVKGNSELLEQRTELVKVDEAQKLDEATEEIITAIEKKPPSMPLKRLLRLAPDEMQAEIAIQRLDEALRKVEKGFSKKQFKDRNIIDTAGDLVNILNLARVASEEAVQKALRDVNRILIFVGRKGKEIRNQILLEGRAVRDIKRGKIADPNTLENTLKQLSAGKKPKGELPPAKTETPKTEDIDDPWFLDDTDAIDPDTYISGKAATYHRDIEKLLDEAQEAIDNEAVSFEFLEDWVKRIEDLQNKAIADGVTPAPIKTVFDDLNKAAKESEQLLEPKVESPLQTPIPIKSVDGEFVPDVDAINQLVDVSTKNTEPNKPFFPQQFQKRAEEIANEGMTPKTLAELEGIADDVDELIDELVLLKEYDAAHNTNLLEDRLNILRRANATTYTPDLTDQALLKIVNDRIVKRAPKSQQALSQASIIQLSQFTNDPEGVKQLAWLLEQGRINKANLKKIHSITTTLSLTDFNTRNAMASLVDLKNVQKGIDTKGLTLEEAQLNALRNIKMLMVAVRAVDPLAEQYGKGLQQFQRKLRPKFFKNREEFYEEAWNQTLMGVDDTEEMLDKVSEAGKKAMESFEETMGTALTKLKNNQPLNDDELAKALAISDALYMTGGNLRKINEIQKTSTGAVNRIIRSGLLSNPAGPVGIWGYAAIDSSTRHLASIFANYGSLPFLRFLGKEALKPELLKRGRLQALWLRSYYYSLMNSWDTIYNKLIFPDSHPDYQVNPVSLLNESDKLKDLKANEFNVPIPFFGKWVVRRLAKDDKVFDFLNKGRVLFKSMHDNFATAEMWDQIPIGKLNPLNPKETLSKGWIRGWDTGVPIPGTGGKNLRLPGLGVTTEILRAAGLGTKQYYAGASNEAMTGIMKLLNAGDSVFTGVSGNAYFRAVTEMEVYDDVAAGLIPPAEAKAEIMKRMDKAVSNIYKPERVGVEQEIIGYGIADEQFNQFKNIVNLTEELTGPAKDGAEAIKILQNSENPALSSAATFLIPVISSAFNYIRNSTKVIAGIEAAQGAFDATRAVSYVAREHLGEKVERMMPQWIAKWVNEHNPGFLRNAREFESKYLHEDIKIRERAQQALGLSIAWFATASYIVWNSDMEVTGPMTHTYREGKGLKYPYMMKLPFELPLLGSEIPLLYLGPFGAAIALQATVRDIGQFSNDDELRSVVSMGLGGLARQMLELPFLTGTDQLNEALSRADQGDLGPMQRLFAKMAAVYGRPYRGYEKMLTRTFVTQEKAADPLSGLGTNKWYKKGKDGFAQWNTGRVIDTFVGTLGYFWEETGIGTVMNGLMSFIADDETLWLASRAAQPFGKPGEVIRWSDYPKLAYPIHAFLGKFAGFKSKTDDPVSKAVLENLILPFGPETFRKEGVGLSKSMANEFNHFLNNDALIPSDYDPSVIHVGIYDYILELVTHPDYTQLPGSDLSSPYTTGNWDRQNSIRADWLKTTIRNKVNIIKNQWLEGNNKIPDEKSPTGYRDQIWVAPPELRDLIYQSKED
tara:strand:- start:717 stop:7070 length:6354 start_codon:yes stop_codon:yes gene_type:complete